ncbi:helicase [Dictyobacter alpinus]|uniref:Helicase n=1 Tax=Dictyobacter alpinus TaxID=2014873 RepID=A0A402B0D5_9CHLR|nr:DEAD/DEAH box helicase [Dictyobacter alpinus]GCE24810.1 helicase [Dictyobacter alpinus]
MHIIHGTWIPDDSQGFIRSGAFYLWVETDLPPSVVTKSKDAVHPRHLTQATLTTFLVEKLKLADSFPDTVKSNLVDRYFLLPTTAGKPAPSFELLRYVEEEEPLEFELMPWQICCYKVSEILTVLNLLHFMALNGAEDFQLGADLLFWHYYAQALKAIIAKDQYIPALKYQDMGTIQEKKNTRSKKATKKEASFILHPSWELISDTYETLLQRYLTAMPGVCTAGLSTPDNAVLFEEEALLRHFSECLLHNIVTGTPFTGAFDHQIADTLLYRCIYPYRPAPIQDPAEALQDYKHWLAWRTNLTGVHTDAGFTLCFRLEEAPSTDIDNWHMHFLVAAKHDPSLQLSLHAYWELEPRERVEAVDAFGEDFEKNILLALGYAARIYPKIWDGLATDKPAGYQLTLDEAFAFLKESAWVLEDSGYIVIVPAWWTPEGRRRSKVRLKTALRSPKGSTNAPQGGHLSLKKVVDYSYELSIGGQVVSEEEWRQLVNAKSSLVQFRGEWMELDREKMQQMLEFWQTHQHESTEISLMDMLKLGAEGAEELEWEHDHDLQDMLAQLDNKNAIAPIADPVALQGTLREYQKRGVAWLHYLESLGMNPCLADDMGLGKTLQVIACLLKEREETESIGPTLIIAPTSVLGNWRKEIERFAPKLQVLVHQGGTRPKDKQAFLEMYQEQDVILTSFALARLDEKLLQSIDWHRVVVDEAQNIKNPQAAQTRAILKLTAPHRLALTGTPVENRLRDLWSIFNFLNPGYLGKEAQFRKNFELPIYKDNNATQSTTLKKLVEPFILRRVKTDKRIINDLPDKIEQKMYCTLSSEQASLYEAVVKDVMEQLDEAEGIQRKGLILSTLLRLKQICNHPMQFLQDGSAFTTERSHKLQRLTEMVEEVIDSGESALIFTQFTEIGGALERYLENKKHYNTYYLHGATNVARREKMVTEFQDPVTEPSLFILSLRAGGVGLNLTKANHVFHFDRWWNPSVEDQATDRAFRIGQRKNVFVHKFIAMGTMEERIDAMIEDKKRLSSLVVGTDESWLTELDNDTFKDLITLRRSAIME